VEVAEKKPTMSEGQTRRNQARIGKCSKRVERGAGPKGQRKDGEKSKRGASWGVLRKPCRGSPNMKERNEIVFGLSGGGSVFQCNWGDDQLVTIPVSTYNGCGCYGNRNASTGNDRA